jgi:hypothetical protein
MRQSRETRELSRRRNALIFVRSRSRAPDRPCSHAFVLTVPRRRRRIASSSGPAVGRLAVRPLEGPGYQDAGASVARSHGEIDGKPSPSLGDSPRVVRSRKCAASASSESLCARSLARAPKITVGHRPPLPTFHHPNWRANCSDRGQARFFLLVHAVDAPRPPFGQPPLIAKRN